MGFSAIVGAGSMRILLARQVAAIVTGMEAAVE
jgi:hypothetical protein